MIFTLRSEIILHHPPSGLTTRLLMNQPGLLGREPSVQIILLFRKFILPMRYLKKKKGKGTGREKLIAHNPEVPISFSLALGQTHLFYNVAVVGSTPHAQ